MAITVSTVDREFSPAEVEAITGVSTALQRDWRRRGILPQKADSKWSKHGLTDLIEIMTLQTFSAAGFSVKDVAQVSRMSILPTLYFILANPKSFTWESDFEVPQKIREMTEASTVVGAQGRYLVMAHVPGVSHPFEITCRPDSLASLEDWVTANKATAFTVLDFENIANFIVEKAGPVIRFEATRS